MMAVFGLLIKGTLVKYWIFCCCFMFFIISFSDKVSVYKILYICLFLFCVVLYEVSYDLFIYSIVWCLHEYCVLMWCVFVQVQYEMWRRVLKHFWMVVVAYSMMVLILIYVYQFKSVSGLFQQILGVTEERWALSSSVFSSLCHVLRGVRMFLCVCQVERFWFGTVWCGWTLRSDFTAGVISSGLHPSTALLQQWLSHSNWSEDSTTGQHHRQVMMRDKHRDFRIYLCFKSFDFSITHHMSFWEQSYSVIKNNLLSFLFDVFVCDFREEVLRETLKSIFNVWVY